MTVMFDMLVPALLIGTSATVIMDLWGTLLRKGFGVATLDYGLLGRWVGHFGRGRFRHESIVQAVPIGHERVIGWSAHYSIGIVFALLLLVVAGPEWASHPTIGPPLLVSSVTLVAPFFVMQPAMGSGIAASRTPRPNAARLRSVVTHTVYGVGLYVSAWVWAVFAG